MVRHLYNSRVEVLRLTGTIVNGSPILDWVVVTAVVDPKLGTPGQLLCRLDLTFLRPGKDAPMPVVAGRAQDRIGVMFFDTVDTLKAGDRVRCLAGPIVGTFEVRSIPDPAVAFSAAHHMEVQVVEVAQQLQGVFPGANVEE